jgi:protein-tyrosine phosphatase
VSEQQDEIIGLASADNFRDVAGAGYPVQDGRRMRRGMFYRSNALALADEDAAEVAGLGLRAVLDMRSEFEIERTPDRAIDGATWLHYDVIGIPMEQLADLTQERGAEAVMAQVYTAFVTDGAARARFGDLFRQLATGGPQVFHCSHGKDRTGWVASLLLHIAGVDDDVIVEDYLLSNELTVGSRTALEETIEELRGPELVEALRPTMIVDESYLRTSWDAVAREFGDRTTYLRDGLGLGADTLDRLRGLLVE